LKINFEINFENVLSKVSTLHTGNNFRKPTSTTPTDDAVDALFDVCKHWPTDQSEHSIREILFGEILQNRTCSTLRNTLLNVISFES